MKIKHKYRVRNSEHEGIDLRGNRLGRLIRKYEVEKLRLEHHGPEDGRAPFMIVEQPSTDGNVWCRTKSTDPNRLGMAHFIHEAMDSLVEQDVDSAVALLNWVALGLKRQHHNPSLAGADKHQKGWTDDECKKANENLVHKNVLRWREDENGDKSRIEARDASYSEIQDVINDASIHAEFALRSIQQKSDSYWSHEAANDAGKAVSLLDYAKVALESWPRSASGK